MWGVVGFSWASSNRGRTRPINRHGKSVKPADVPTFRQKVGTSFHRICPKSEGRPLDFSGTPATCPLSQKLECGHVEGVLFLGFFWAPCEKKSQTITPLDVPTFWRRGAKTPRFSTPLHVPTFWKVGTRTAQRAHFPGMWARRPGSVKVGTSPSLALGALCK